MQAAGLEVRELAGTGLVATLTGAHPGPTVLVRAEMDALPIEETNDVAYRSTHPGVSHACGHDAHCAIATTVAQRFAEERDQLRGTLKFAFQPAEETASGALRMVQEGALEAPRVDAALSAHVWQPMPVGVVGVAAGPIWAGVDHLDFVVHGAPGHGAMPHQGIDAIVISAQLVTALQTVVSRTRSPLEPAVFSLGTIHGGTTWNIIADRVEMNGTLRTFDPGTRERLLHRINAIAHGVAESFGGSCDVHDDYSSPPVVNDQGISEIGRAAFTEVVGEANVVPSDLSLVGDDFAHFIQEVPGCLFHIGSANPAKGLDHGHHDSAFDIDEDCLPIAAASLDAYLRALLAKL
jgi:amidohydrolase